MSTSPDDDVDVNELLILSDVDDSLQSLALKHHLAMKSVRSVLVLSVCHRLIAACDRRSTVVSII